MIQRPGVSLGFPPVTNTIRILIIINVVVYFVQALATQGPFGEGAMNFAFNHLFGLVPGYVLTLSHPPFIWQLGTYLFLHGSFLHIFFNMLLLWMFGSQIEMVWGPKGFLKYFFICGIGAGIVVTLASVFAPATRSVPTIGASGAIFGVLIAYGMLFPNQTVLLMFILPVKAKYVVWLAVAMEFLMLFSANNHGISNTAHLGGALVGYIYLHYFIRHGWNLRAYLQSRKAERMKNRLRLVRFDDDKDDNPKMYH